jgi:3-oxoacyl-[acyl-carrier protein] reductase
MSRTSFPNEHVSLVTGASTGIGAATARQLAEAGSRVAVHYHQSREAALGVVQQIEAAGGRAFVVQANLAKPAAAAQLVEQVGRVDCLVNNAGSMIGRRKLLEITPEFWNEVMETNLSSVLRVTQAVVPGMIERGSGTIINIASVAARNGGGPGVMAYATAKAAVVCLTKGLAKELASSGIRVNAVNPGVIATPFHEKFTSEAQMKALVANIPQGRAGTSEEIASVIAFLASDGASHMTGESVEVNGGLWMD